MKRPIAIAVDVVDPKRGGALIADAITHADIHDKEVARAGISSAIGIGIVERVVLQAAVARAQRSRPALADSIRRQCVSPPTRYSGLPLANACRKVVVRDDLRMRIRQARRQVETA
jgi:hypothetical protein